MKSLSLARLPQLHTQFHKYLPLTRLKALWQQAQPRAYHYLILPWSLLQALVLAYLTRASGLRQLAQTQAPRLGTANFSSLAHALARKVFADFLALALASLQPHWTPGEGDLVPLDSMALTLPKTQRHGCKKFNNKTVGGGVIWAWLIRAGAGVCPLQVLRVVEGAWSDAKQMRTLPLMALGPVYLMDRGFYALQLLQEWLGRQVHFIIRVRLRSLVYTPLCELSAPRRLGRLELEWDGLVLLGGPRAKVHPRVRLLRARLGSGELLVLATDQWLWSAERVLEAYRQRWQIERFHKLLKDALGLAHLYSFQQDGLRAQILVAALLAVLLYLAGAEGASAQALTVDVIRRHLTQVRGALGLGTPWRRNSCIRPRSCKRRNKRKATQPNL